MRLSASSCPGKKGGHRQGPDVQLLFLLSAGRPCLPVSELLQERRVRDVEGLRGLAPLALQLPEDMAHIAALDLFQLQRRPVDDERAGRVHVHFPRRGFQVQQETP